ncbi:MAG: PQQ-binding-like beta-propeller repeat protein [Corynebacterium sp.]|nr:PQQ-binding-like beta-propeller repeat protein [Corynebacterium sp.]
MNGVTRGIVAACLLVLTSCAVRTDAEPTPQTSVTVESATSVSFAPAEFQSYYTVYQPGFVDKSTVFTGMQRWSVNLHKTRGLYAVGDPIQVGNTVVLNTTDGHTQTGVLALSAANGDVLWQDRALSCTSVDVGGSLICSKNGEGYAPYDMDNGTVGSVINPGFEPSSFLYHEGVLYSVGTNGTGAILVAAGTPAEPSSLWSAQVARPADLVDASGLQTSLELSDTALIATVGSASATLNPATGATISVGPKLLQQGLVSASEASSVVEPGLRQVATTNHSVILTDDTLRTGSAGVTVDLVHPANTSSLHGSVILDSVSLVYGSDDVLSAYTPEGVHLWDYSVRLASGGVVTDGEVLYISGVNGVVVLDLATGAEKSTIPGGTGTSISAGRGGILQLSNAKGTLNYFA